MTKFKLIVCVCILLFLSYTVCFATSDIDMNLTSNSTSNSSSNSTNNNNSSRNTNSNNSTNNTSNSIDEDTESTYAPSAQVSSTTSSESNELRIGDIINICLIVVGILLILLSIAILIRLKS